MADLIDKQSVLEIVMCYCPDDDGCCSKAGHDLREMLDEIEALPTIEPEVRHGRWIVRGHEIYCSECNEESLYNPFGASKFSRFCSNCGSMNLEVSEDVGTD